MMIKINRHARRRQHRREMKKRYALADGFHNVKAHERHERERYAENSYLYRRPLRNGGYEYWKRWEWGSRKKYFQRHANAMVRREFREQLAKLDPEDVAALNRNSYKKIFDLGWELW